MSRTNNLASNNPLIQTLRTFKRFTIGQRWEHALLILTVLVLLLTGLPQKYRATEWSQQILSTPERLATLQQIHHITAFILSCLIVYHLAHTIYLMSRRQLPDDMLPTLKDIRDALHMALYLLFIKKEKPAFGKFNFEQKVTYWFIFFGIGILSISGLILLYPEFFTRFLPGGIVPAAILAHSSESIVLAVFVLIWHFYHVHLERLNLSIFTGWLNDSDMCTYHSLEYQRLMNTRREETEPGEKNS
jgi:formate dehydrogenase subunit gamma